MTAAKKPVDKCIATLYALNLKLKKKICGTTTTLLWLNHACLLLKRCTAKKVDSVGNSTVANQACTNLKDATGQPGYHSATFIL